MADDDVQLPHATVMKMIKESLPNGMRVSADASKMLMECCHEFVQLIASQANEVATKGQKNIINAEHVISALEELDFRDYLAEVQVVWSEWKKESKAGGPKIGPRVAKKASDMMLTEEEQIELQQKMFAEARARSLQLPESMAGAARSAAGDGEELHDGEDGEEQEEEEEEEDMDGE